MQENFPTQLNQILQNSRVDYARQWIEGLYFSRLTMLKVLSVFLTTFFVVSTLFFMIKTGWLALRIDRTEDVFLKRNPRRRRSRRGWEHVQKHFFKGDDNSLKIALIEADKILDDTLRNAGFKGENLGERLKKIDRSQLPNLDEIWEAHKFRNKIVHETDFKLNRDTAERALGVYERTFKDLGLID